MRKKLNDIDAQFCEAVFFHHLRLVDTKMYGIDRMRINSWNPRTIIFAHYIIRRKVKIVILTNDNHTNLSTDWIYEASFAFFQQRNSNKQQQVRSNATQTQGYASKPSRPKFLQPVSCTCQNEVQPSTVRTSTQLDEWRVHCWCLLVMLCDVRLWWDSQRLHCLNTNKDNR